MSAPVVLLLSFLSDVQSAADTSAVEAGRVVVDALARIARQRHRPKILRVDVRLPADSPWRYLWRNGAARDDALMVFTGLDVGTFNALLRVFAPLYTALSSRALSTGPRAGKGGRPRMFAPRTAAPVLPHRAVMLSLGARAQCRALCFSRAVRSDDALSACLHHLRTRASWAQLGLIFGAPETTLNTLWFWGSRALLRALRKLPAAAFHWPTAPTELSSLSERITQHIPELHRVVGFVDGLSLPVQQPHDYEMQNAYYSGYTSQHQVPPSRPLARDAPPVAPSLRIHARSGTHSVRTLRCRTSCCSVPTAPSCSTASIVRVWAL